MIEVEAPNKIVSFNFLCNEDFVADIDVHKEIIKCLIRGIIDLHNILREKSDEVVRIIWLSIFNDRYYFNENDYKNLPGDTFRIAKSWAVLISNFSDGDEDTIFKYLKRDFSLKNNMSLKCTGTYHIFDYEPNLIGLTNNNFIYFGDDIKDEFGFLSKSEPLQEISISFSKNASISFWDPDFEERRLINCGLLFDISMTNAVWEKLLADFASAINNSKGIPNYVQLVSILKNSGVFFSEEKIDALGETTIEIFDRLCVPSITINSSIDERLRLIVLTHEIGHMIMHLPVLIAQKLLHYFSSLEFWRKRLDLDDALLEKEANWVGALILFPPIVEHLISTIGPNRDPERSQFFTTNRVGEAFQETNRWRIWKNLKRNIFGIGEESWEQEFEDQETYFRLNNRFLGVERKQNGSETYSDMINYLLFSFAYEIEHREESSLMMEKRNSKIQMMIDTSFKIIFEYLSGFENE